MHTIVLVEPRKVFRSGLVSVLSAGFRVEVATSLPAALRIVALKRPRAILASLFQAGEENGLTVCKRVRQQYGDSITTFVYGAPKGGVDSARRQDMERRFGVDLFVARSMELAVLGDHLASELRRAMLHTESAVMRRYDAASDVQGRPSLDARVDRSVSEDTWAEILRREASARTLSALISKPIGVEPIDRSWSDSDPTWGEIMQTKATPRAMRVLARKAFGLRLAKKTA